MILPLEFRCFDNTVTLKELFKINGIGTMTVKKNIAGCPYATSDELVTYYSPLVTF
jgi:hypothetical protein